MGNPSEQVCMTCGHVFGQHDEHLECNVEDCFCVLFDVAPYHPEHNPDPERRFVEKLRAELATARKLLDDGLKLYIEMKADRDRYYHVSLRAKAIGATLRAALVHAEAFADDTRHLMIAPNICHPKCHTCEHIAAVRTALATTDSAELLADRDALRINQDILVEDRTRLVGEKAVLRAALERVVAADDDPPNYSMHADICRRQPGACTCHMAQARAVLATVGADHG